MVGILTNASSLAAQNALQGATRTLETSMERLSTGKRINSAADDAAGLAIAQRMESQVTGLNMATKNAVDGQAMVGSVDSAMAEVDDILQRMRELAVQSVNGTNSAADRSFLQSEVAALQSELTRISNTSKFNGQLTLDGNLSKSLQVGTDANQTIAFTVGSVAAGSLGHHVIDAGPNAANAQSSALSGAAAVANQADGTSVVVTGNNVSKTITTVAADSAKDHAAAINTETANTGVSATAVTKVKVDFSAAISVSMKINGTALATFTSGNGGSHSAFINAVNAVSGTTGVTAELSADKTYAILTDATGEDITYERTDTNSGNIELTNIKSDGTLVTGTMNVAESDGASATTKDHGRSVGYVVYSSHIGAFTVDDGSGNAAENYTGQVAAKASTQSYVSSVDVGTAALAAASISIIDGALGKIASERASLGALNNRLDHVISHLSATAASTGDALGKLQDADYSVESANLAKAQVLMQAGTAMLAQANAQPQMVLQLIQ